MKEFFKSAVHIILINDNKILLQKRKGSKLWPGYYALPAGHIDEGETQYDALVREAKEELGIDIQEKDLQLVSVLHPYQEEYMNIFFSTRKFEGTPQIIEKEKCDDLRWFNLNNLPDNTIERIKQVIKCMENGIIYDDGNFSYLKMKQAEIEEGFDG